MFWSVMSQTQSCHSSHLKFKLTLGIFLSWKLQYWFLSFIWSFWMIHCSMVSFRQPSSNTCSSNQQALSLVNSSMTLPSNPTYPTLSIHFLSNVSLHACFQNMNHFSVVVLLFANVLNRLSESGRIFNGILFIIRFWSHFSIKILRWIIGKRLRFPS